MHTVVQHGSILQQPLHKRKLLGIRTLLIKRLCKSPHYSLRKQISASAVIDSPIRDDSRDALNTKRAFSGLLPSLITAFQATALALALFLQISCLRASQIAQQGITKQEAVTTLLLLYIAFGAVQTIYRKTRQKATSKEPSLSSSGSARLARVEIIQNRQIATAATVDKDLNNLRVRLRVLTKDIQPAVRQVQAENGVQAEAIGKLSERLESASRQIEDTQQMLNALHGVSAKQLQLVVQALEIVKGRPISTKP